MSAVAASKVKYFSPIAAEKENKRKKTSAVWVKYAAAAACLAIIVFTIPKIALGPTKSADNAAPEASGNYEVKEADTAADAKAEKNAVHDSAIDESAANDMSEDTPEESENEDKADGSQADINDAPENEEPQNICTITVFGELPEILADSTQNDNGDGSYTIYISKETAASLLDLGYDVYYSGSEAEEVTDYIVTFVP